MTEAGFPHQSDAPTQAWASLHRGSRYFLSGVAILTLAIATIFGALQVESFASLTADCALTFLLILSILWLALFVEVAQRPFSLHLMHLVSVYIFLAAAPLYQVLYGAFPLPTYARVDPSYVVRANLVVIAWLVSYLLFYALGRRWTSARRLRRGQSDAEGSVSAWRIDAALLASLAVLGYLATLGLAGETTRGGAEETFAGTGSSPLVLINETFVRGFPIVALGAGFLLLSRNFRKSALTTGPLTLVCLLGNIYANNPLAAPRYWTIAVVLGLVAPHLLQRRATGVLTLAGVAFAFCILPQLGIARDAHSFSEMIDYLRETGSPVGYLARSGDVDAYGILVLIFRYIERNGLSYGHQLIGVLLFWFPRSIWITKPISTGALVGDQFGAENTNLSAPIVAEPLIDFGWPGVLILAALFGLLVSYIDTAFWGARSSRSRGVRPIDTIYPFLLGMMVFVTRGALLSGVAYTVGLTTSAVFAFFLGPGAQQRQATELVHPEDVLIPEEQTFE